MQRLFSGIALIGLVGLAYVSSSCVNARSLSRPVDLNPSLAPSGEPLELSLPAGLASRSPAKYEPDSGCYLGAYIELDPTLKKKFVDQNGNKRKLPSEFEKVAGKKHAMYFFYLGYGRPLPLDWVKYLASDGKFVHVALEPNNGLGRVKDDAYLRKLARDMRDSGAKIFLRFASEMNGDWTNYSGDPARYVQKFRLVSRIMKEIAPNVAMVWCPYTTPRGNIQSYYPGDDWVDWVGVNMYNVTFYNENLKTPARHVRPTDMLDFVYDRYASRKPIMIGEYGTTHFSKVEGKASVEYARRNIEELYRMLQTEYRRVKAINYFNSNNLKISRANNDYSVTCEPKVLDTYRKAVANPWFLSRPSEVVAENR